MRECCVESVGMRAEVPLRVSVKVTFSYLEVANGFSWLDGGRQWVG
jgi:hypothetical protein